VRNYSNPTIFAYSRLRPMLRMHGLSTLSALRERVVQGDPKLTDEVLNALTTHESSFFRNAAMFRWLEAFGLDRLRDGLAPGAPLRAWSAGCATGEEVLSVAMLLVDHCGERPWELLGTDVSRTAIAFAEKAQYNTLQVNRGLGARQLLRWFDRKGVWHGASPELMRHITWRVHNLVLDPPPMRGLDLVLARNVLLYFNDADRITALSCIARAMRPGAILVVGHAEGMMSAVTDGPFSMHRDGSVTYFTKNETNTG